MNLEHLPNELFDLLAAKTYAQLSEQEKAMVSPFINANEYDDYRQLVLDFQTIDHDLEQELTDSPLQAPKKVSRIRRVLNYKIPAYQVAAGFLVLLAANFAFRNYDDRISPIDATPATKASYPAQSLSDDAYPDSLIFVL